MSIASLPGDVHDTEHFAHELKEFIYILSHDLNTPLRAVVEFSKLLKAEHGAVLNDEGKEYLSLIIESGDKMQSMIAGLLDYSRLNTMKKPFSNVNCNSIVSDCSIVLKEKIEANKATIEVMSLPIVRADAEQLMQLFLMLLDNALTYHKKEEVPHVEITVEKKETAWQFAIKDNGIGIAQEFHARIFQPFHRLHTDSEYAGTGMGLTLARKIVERHGGTIQVVSVPGQGACFTFSIPDREAN